MSISILEARQTDTNSIVSNNGDWETILLEEVILENGDTLSMTEAFCDTTENQPNSIFIKEDITLKIDYCMYQTLDSINIPNTGGTVDTEGDGSVMTFSQTRIWNVNGIITKGCSPSPLCKWATPINTSASRIDGFTIMYVDVAKKMLGGIPLILEYTDLTGRVVRQTIQFPERPANQNILDITYNAIVVVIDEFKKTEGLSLGDGILVDNRGTIRILNPEDAKAGNFIFVEALLVPADHQTLVPYIQTWEYILPAGRYHPKDLATILTRATQEIGNDKCERANEPNPANSGEAFTSRIAKGYEPNTGGSSQDGQPFYTDQRYFDMITPGRNAAEITGTNAIILGNGLYDKFGFVFNESQMPYVLPTEQGLTRQVFSYKNEIITSDPTGEGAIDPQTQDLDTPKMMRLIGSSEAIGFSFDEDANRFQIDFLHSPYYRTAGDATGDIGTYANFHVIADKLTTPSSGGILQPVADYAFDTGGSIGGVLLTALQPTSFWKQLGFDLRELTCVLSTELTAMPSTTGTYAWSNNTHLEAGRKNQFQFCGQPDFDSVLNDIDYTPHLPYIVCPYSFNNRSIQGGNSMRNYFYGRKMTAAYIEKSDIITFNTSSASPPPDRAGYIWSNAAFPGFWAGAYDTTTFAQRIEMTGYIAPTENTSTSTTLIQAQDFALGTELSSAYYLVEIGGIFKNRFIGSTTYSRFITGILNRYYSSGQFTSGSTPFTYTHMGNEPLILKSLKVRILNPDGTLANTIGSDNSIILTITKSNKNLARSNIPILDQFSTKQAIEGVKQLQQQIG